MWVDDLSACPYLYTEGLSDELAFFAQARPRRMICHQYHESDSNVTQAACGQIFDIISADSVKINTTDIQKSEKQTTNRLVIKI